MDYLSQMFADPTQERTFTVKTKPSKSPQAPESPLSQDSANLPAGVLEMLMGAGAQAAPQPEISPGLLEMLMGGTGGGGPPPSPMGMDPMAGQIPMEQFNPYGV
jgi:hypothetical protein